MASQIIFDSGSAATPVSATSLNVAGASTLGPLTAGASTLGATVVTGLSTTGNVGAASLNVTTATVGTLVSTTAITASGTVTVPELTTDAIAIPSGDPHLLIFAVPPAAQREYELPDIGVNGEIAIGTTASYQAAITNLANTVTYTSIDIIAVRTARTVTISFDTGLAFDGMGETALFTSASSPLPVRYRPPTGIFYFPIMVRSGGAMGVGYAYVTPQGLIAFVGRDGGTWTGADCLIINGGFSYNI